MEALGPAPPAAVPPVAADPTPEEPTAASRQGEDTWQVRPGDSFWSIAHEVLVQHGEERPSDEEVADYWRRLLRANGAQLASSDHPDLLFPGQILEVPPP
jgi:nucleoid-associated protein YgaU